MTSRRSFRSEVAQTTATNIAIAVSGIVTGVLVARLLAPEGRGELAAIMNPGTFAGVLATLGLGEALVYWPARDRESSGRYLGTSLLMTLSASALVAAAGWVAMPALLAAQEPEIVSAARWYLLQVPVAAVLGIAARPLRGSGDISGWNLLRSTPTAVWLAVVTAAWAQGTVSATDLAIAFVVIRALTIPFVLLAVRLRLAEPIRPKASLARPLLRFGIPNMAAVIPGALNYRLDQLVLAAIVSGTDLGLYAAAVAWSMLPQPALLAFGNVLFPRVAAAEPSLQPDLVARGIRAGALVAGAAGIITVALAPIALPALFGSDFADATPSAVVLSVAGAAAGLNTVVRDVARGLDLSAAVLRAEAGGLGVTLIALTALVDPLGIEGAALASLLAYTTALALLVTAVARATGLRARSLLVPRMTDARNVLAAASGRQW